MWNLPQKNDTEKDPHTGIGDGTGGGRPSAHRGEGAGYRPHNHIGETDALERGVGREVENGGDARNESGNRVHHKNEPGETHQDQRGREEQGVGRGNALHGQWTIAGADHQLVEVAFDVLVVGRGAAGDEKSTQHGMKKGDVTHGTGRAQEKTDRHAGQNEHGDAGLGKLSVIGQRWGREGSAYCFFGSYFH